VRIGAVARVRGTAHAYAHYVAYIGKKGVVQAVSAGGLYVTLDIKGTMVEVIDADLEPL
jgi:hypothetical protein